MQSVGMILYILLFGIIAGGIWTVLNRDCIEDSMKLYSLKSVLFFFAGIYFTVSAIKSYLDEAEITLTESFWDVVGRTYLHYGIVFIAISIVVPLLMKRLFSSYGYHLVHIFDFIYVAVIVIELLLFGRINNKNYCILYVFCMLVGGFISFYNDNRPIRTSKYIRKNLVYHHPIEYIGREEFKSRFIEALPFVSAWVVMTGVYFPNELYIHNIEEFVGNYAAFFLIMLIGSVAEILLLMVVFLLFLPKKLFRVMYLLFAGISCAGYLQSMFLNGTLNTMNGEEQIWPVHKLFVNICIWIVILLISVIGGYRKKAIRKICQMLCVYISLIQLVTLGWLLLTSDIKNQNQYAAITNKGSLELAQENNVLVFVLDNFDSSWFEEIYQDDSSILEPLMDFTFYRNGTSQFAFTDLGIPYMLTGVEWNTDVDNYFQYAYENSNVLEKIAERGTDVRVFTDLNLMSKELYQRLDNYSDSIIRKYNFVKTYCTMMKSSMYKIAPFLLKSLYGYYTSDIKEMTYNNDIWSIDNDLWFYYDIVEKGLSVSETYKTAFRFYHMRGPHNPYYMTENLRYDPTGSDSSADSQGKGSLKIVYEYLEQMKALGKYNDATIIITADHGQKHVFNIEGYDGKIDDTSRPLFLVKKPGECHEKMDINEAPVSQEELIPTILKAFDLEYASYGRAFEEIPIDDQRVRTYRFIYSNYNIEFLIDGHAADLDSWSIGSAAY
ncbi:MAG: sulfatase-like hydrolase/transferase [Lachnospiraceae bacterium]|nr:sulfatase-like hydrolase/transferase [Lachnospiraceae bacterium]